MYTHVIFDLDGTILNTLDDLADAGNYVCQSRGWLTHPVEKYKVMVGNGIPKLVERFSPEGTPADVLEEARKEFAAYYGAHKEDKTAPYEGIPEVIALLKGAEVKVSVLTNKADHLARPMVESYFPGVFDMVRGALPDVPTKPHPAMLGGLLKDIGADPERSLFVGDSNVDILTGKNCGLDTCGVLWGFRSREELEGEGATHIAEAPADLLKIVTGTALVSPEKGADILAKGGLVAVPTETVYGLASDAFNETSVQANYDAKGRPETKPLSVLVDGMAMAETVCKDIPLDSYKLAEAFWPGPLTMILKGNGALPSIVPAGGDTQGVRCPDHKDTLAAIKALGRPLACPSANLSGCPSPKSAADVLSQLAGKIDAVVDGGPCSVGVESTIVDMTVTPYRILRQGGLSREAINRVLAGGMKVIGITGPTGAGKTTVLNVLDDLGAVILDCDAVYHELTVSCQPMKEALKARYGAGIFDENDQLLRKKLGAVVFGDEEALADLNRITHHYVRLAVHDAIKQARAEGKIAVAIDAIALLESGLGDLCDATVAVTADDELRMRRIMKRDNITEEYARLRVSAQNPSAWFEERCDHTLRNDGDDPSVVETQAQQLFASIIH